MNLFLVNTTAYSEEDFILATDLTEQEIMECITPIVFAERYGGKNYMNDDLFLALRNSYPNAEIVFATHPNKIVI